MDELQRVFEQAFQINEMATIGICYGQRVVTNSLDHGAPHVHYGKVKVYLPKTMPKNATELLEYVEKSHRSRLADKSLTEMINWFKEKSKLDSTHSNFEMCWILWNAEHPDF